ncbi:MAG: sigma-B regulation protein RsbU (phosphoserine phosphatase) [Cellvibrionaceae bacterium]|jgi:sigma-B regulation protein RsbU (phosphoserine phosphatase)
MQNSDYKLLVIDDDLAVRQKFVDYFQNSDFQVYSAPDGQSGLDLFGRLLPDLVVTELRLPDMDGLALLSNFYQHRPEIPVILISDAGVMDDVVDALRLGAADYLIKPIDDMRVLQMAVKRSLERRHLLIENYRYRQQLEIANSSLKKHIESLEQDQRAGHFVQQSMLPVSPFVALGYTCELKLIPSLFLSGDCIDYALLDKRYYAFYVADVSGHGSAPAFVTIWLKNLVSQLVRLRQLLADFDSIHRTLKQMVTVINDELIAIHLNNYLTMAVGIIDTNTHELFYIVAGHLPLPVVITHNNAHYLEGSGKPIGLYEDADWTVNHVHLPEACSIAIFSDGILEIIPGEDLLVKEKNLLSLLAETDGSLSEINRKLGLYKTSNTPDDIALLVVTRNQDELSEDYYVADASTPAPA